MHFSGKFSQLTNFSIILIIFFLVPSSTVDLSINFFAISKYSYDNSSGSILKKYAKIL